ncbi:hypothetical protein [Amycolatopsis orientalis]|uniref:hypothetical protein n=1 Tax=Amycolatopsis orientalis TaxID=31958 RepID=UPI000559C195|nr:hypothetical protein [Amycolatopsis orientalis]
MEAAETFGEATRTGSPIAVVGCCVLLLLVLAATWLCRTRRSTVRDPQARLDYEVQAELEQARLAEFRRTAEQAAAERAGEEPEVVPKGLPEAGNPRKQEKPDQARCGQERPAHRSPHRYACPSLARHATSPGLGQASALPERDEDSASSWLVSATGRPRRGRSRRRRPVPGR